MDQVHTETIEGVIGERIWFHYDVPSDVLYLRIWKSREAPSVAEETDDGLLSIRHEETNDQIGLTIVNWWKRFGTGKLPDSIRELEHRIEPWGRRIAA